MTVNPFNTVGLSVMFILFAVLILWSIIGARGWWWLKVPVIAGTLYFGLAVWYSVDSHLGWATYHDPPRKFMVEWMVVDEPDNGSSRGHGWHNLEGPILDDYWLSGQRRGTQVVYPALL